MLHHPNHLLAPLLPNETHAPYHLRPRRHNRQLIPKINKLYDSSFIQCMLYTGGLVVGRPTVVREDPGSNLTAAGRVYHDSHCDE